MVEISSLTSALAMRQWFGLASLALAICALAGTLYALGFAVFGIFAGFKKKDEHRSLLAADGEACSTNFLVVIPAHNESAGLISTVASVLSQAYPQHRLRCVVIADNCTDDTAEVAAGAGAQVLIRTDPSLRGKGHALAWAFALAQGMAWDAVCVIDADSVLAPGFFAALDSSLQRGHEVVQSRGDFLPVKDPTNWLRQFAEASKAGENSFVYRSRERLGLLLLLQGNGFCIARAALERVPWRAYSIVEDAEYGLTLAQYGLPVHYQERARVWSRLASTVRDVQPQRVRWASGTWQLFRRGIPTLLMAAWRRRSPRALEGIVMLVMTSRLLLIYLLATSFLLSLVLNPLTHLTWGLLAITAVLQLFYIILMFHFASDEPTPLRGLYHLPYYVALIASTHVLAVLGWNRRVWGRTAR